MSAKVRYWSFVSALAIGVVAVVAALGAQDRWEAQGPETRDDRRVMMLDGRGSRLGVMVRDLEPSEANAATGGVKIDSIDADGPADKAGLKAGDVVVEFDGERVRSARQFTRLVQETPEGRSVSMAVLRDGQRQTLTATPEARAFSWNVDIDGDRIRRDIERGLEGLRDFRANPPAFDFRFDGHRLVGRARLGVSVNSLTDQLAGYFGATDGGALVTSVQPDSPAQKAGLKAGDVITAVNGNRVRNAGDVFEAMAGVREGEVSIDYLRDRQAGSAKATIERRPDQPRRRGVRPAATRPA